MGAVHRPLISAVVALTVVVAVSLVAAAGSAPPASTSTDPSVPVGGISASGITSQGQFLTIVDLSWSGSSTLGGGSGGGAGKVTLQPFTVTRQLDRFSPLFLQKFLTGVHLQTVVVDVFAPGSQSTQVQYTLSNVLISSFHHFANGTPDYAMPLDRITMRFHKVCMAGFNVGVAPKGANPPVCFTQTA
jgi:hypothetical protein